MNEISPIMSNVIRGTTIKGYIHTRLYHLITVEGVIGSREVTPTHPHGDTSQINTEPSLTSHLRLTGEQVVASRAKHTHLHGHTTDRGRCQINVILH